MNRTPVVTLEKNLSFVRHKMIRREMNVRSWTAYLEEKWILALRRELLNSCGHEPLDTPFYSTCDPYLLVFTKLTLSKVPLIIMHCEILACLVKWLIFGCILCSPDDTCIITKFYFYLFSYF